MKFVRIFATCRDDEEDIIIILCQLKSSNKIDKKIEGFGYIEDWNDESSIHEKYPFILRYKKRKAVSSIMAIGQPNMKQPTFSIK